MNFSVVSFGWFRYQTIPQCEAHQAPQSGGVGDDCRECKPEYSRSDDLMALSDLSLIGSPLIVKVETPTVASVGP